MLPITSFGGYATPYIERKTNTRGPSLRIGGTANLVLQHPLLERETERLGSQIIEDSTATLSDRCSVATSGAGCFGPSSRPRASLW